MLNVGFVAGWLSFVIPAKAGNQRIAPKALDPGLRRGDGLLYQQCTRSVPIQPSTLNIQKIFTAPMYFAGLACRSARMRRRVAMAACVSS